MASSPTQLSMAWLRANGYTPCITEHWNAFARIRQDMYGFIDIVAVRDGETLGIQTTSASNMSAREKKIRASDNWPRLLRAGWKIRVHGWKKNKAGRWELREADIA
jgi:hypothetical protein